MSGSDRLWTWLARRFPESFQAQFGPEFAESGLLPGLTSRDRVRLLADGVAGLVREHLSEWGRDIRLGARLLARSPGFALTVAVALGVGSGIAGVAASTATFFLNAGLPGVQRPDELAAAYRTISYRQYERLPSPADWGRGSA